MINHKHKFIFIHLPSTGGTSIEHCFKKSAEPFTSALQDFDPPYICKEVEKHISPLIAKEIYSEYWHDYFKFSFVRNPWDWLSSLWHKGPRRRRGLSFSKWLLSPTLAPHEQQNMFDLKSELSEMNFIGRFENLQQDFNAVCNHINHAQTQLPHKKSSSLKHYSEYYDAKTREIVAEIYAKDIDFFGYKFENHKLNHDT